MGWRTTLFGRRIPVTAVRRPQRHDCSGDDQSDPNAEQHDLLPAEGAFRFGVTDPERISQHGDQDGHDPDRSDQGTDLPARHGDEQVNRGTARAATPRELLETADSARGEIPPRPLRRKR